MALSDDDLLDFDHRRPAPFDLAPRNLLAQHGDAYRSHLVVARWIDLWGKRLEARPTAGANEYFAEGAAWALHEVTEHLRRGDLLPGGTLYEGLQS